MLWSKILKEGRHATKCAPWSAQLPHRAPIIVPDVKKPANGGAEVSQAHHHHVGELELGPNRWKAHRQDLQKHTCEERR